MRAACVSQSKKTNGMKVELELWTVFLTDHIVCKEFIHVSLSHTDIEAELSVNVTAKSFEREGDDLEQGQRLQQEQKTTKQGN